MLPEPLDPRYVSTDLTYRQEVHHSAAMAGRFQRWLAEQFAAGKVPADDVANLIQLCTLSVECALLAPIAWPELYPADPADDEDDNEPTEAYCLTVRDGDAFEHGMTIKQRPNRPRTRPTMPGCRGAAGHCKNLRAFGERFCPACRHTEKARMRAAAAVG